MSTNTTEGIQSYPHDREGTVSREEFNALVEIVEDQQEQIDELQDELEQKDERIDELESELSEHQDNSAKDRAKIKQRITDLEDRSSDVEPTPQAEETTIQQGDLTPIERLAQSEEVSEVTNSASVERAVSLFENIQDWGVKTPKGYCLRPKDNPRQLLGADRDEDLAWKQYYRAAKSLERLSKGAVTFFDSDRHGKMLVLHERSEVFERVTNNSLSPSSVSASG